MDADQHHNQNAYQEVSTPGHTRNQGLNASYTSQQYKNLSSGLSSISNQKPNNIMMGAIIEAKQQDDHKLQIQNRIIKLKLEEERAHKRIKELNRKQKFIEQMHEEKAKRYEAKANMMRQRRNTEDNNRMKFKQERENSQKRIHQSIERTLFQNRGVYNNIKIQQKHINEMVAKNSVFDLKNKQGQFHQIKDTQVKAKKHMANVFNQNLNHLKDDYDQRVELKRIYANEQENQMRLLEQEESMLLERLKQTQLQEQKMTELLHKTNDMSPVKQLKQQKNSSSSHLGGHTAYQDETYDNE